MRWRDLGRYLVLLLSFTVLDLGTYLLAGWPMNADTNKIIAGFAVVLMAIRDTREDAA